MNPTDYILSPTTVKARFPAELVGTPDYQAIVDACIERLEPRRAETLPPTPARAEVRIQISNTEIGDLRDGYVTLTVSSSRPEPQVRIENISVDSADQLVRARAFTSSETHRQLGYYR